MMCMLTPISCHCSLPQSLHRQSVYGSECCSPSMMGLPSGPASTVKGQCFMSCWTAVSLNLRPISLLASNTVLRGFIATWFLAASPISRSVSVNPTYEGVVRLPWSLAMISTRSFCHTPTQLQTRQSVRSDSCNVRRPLSKQATNHFNNTNRQGQTPHLYVVPKSIPIAGASDMV